MMIAMGSVGMGVLVGVSYVVTVVITLAVMVTILAVEYNLLTQAVYYHLTLPVTKLIHVNL